MLLYAGPYEHILSENGNLKIRGEDEEASRFFSILVQSPTMATILLFEKIFSNVNTSKTKLCSSQIEGNQNSLFAHVR